MTGEGTSTTTLSLEYYESSATVGLHEWSTALSAFPSPSLRNDYWRPSTEIPGAPPFNPFLPSVPENQKNYLIIFEEFGPIYDLGLSFMDKLGRRIADRTGDASETALHRIPVTILFFLCFYKRYLWITYSIWYATR